MSSPFRAELDSEVISLPALDVGGKQDEHDIQFGSLRPKSSTSIPQELVQPVSPAEVGNGSDEPAAEDNERVSVPEYSSVEDEPDGSRSSRSRSLPVIRHQKLVDRTRNGLSRAWTIVLKYSKFIGPGFMISVAYIDPGKEALFLSIPSRTPRQTFTNFLSIGNYATDISAGASFRFKLLFMVLLSNIFAIFLQSLCIKLGSVTGKNLAENCKAHLPKWLNYSLYFLAECAIIATDIAEVNHKGGQIRKISLMMCLAGYWHSYSIESTPKDPSCRWLRYFNCGRHIYINVLQP